MKLAVIISVANQKGGVGKTTTVINLGASLAAAEKKILVVDFDPQTNCTSGFGFPRRSENPTIYDLLTGRTSAKDAVVKSELPNLSIILGSIALAGAEVELANLEEGREQVLKNILDPLRKDYDYILIDCPPSLGLLTVNALTASDALLIPIQAEYFAMEGVSELMRTIERVRENLNPRLSIKGVLLTMVDERTNLARQVMSEVQRHFGSKVYKTYIPRNVRLAEAPSFGKPIIFYDIASRGAQSYLKITEEFLAREA
jgi:chromosome partitioning protein